MFWCNNSIIPLPNKSVLQDVMTRSGVYNEYSFTPYIGMRDVFEQQFRSEAKRLSVERIIKESGYGDYNPCMQHPTSEPFTAGTYASDTSNYSEVLEDIDESWVREYVKNVCIGYKKNSDGLAKVRREYTEVYYFEDKDEDSEEIVSESDLEEKEREYSSEEIIEAKEKLPYLLKQLFNGSRMMGGSLIAAAIAMAKWNKIGEIPSAGKAASCIYTVDMNGRIGREFTARDNTSDKYRNIYAWLMGRPLPEYRVYYENYLELLKVCDVLEIDLAEEDPLVYTAELIDNALCTYLARNEEYMEQYGFADRKILRMLEPDRLFSVMQSLDEDNPDIVALSDLDRAEMLATNLNALCIRNPRVWSESPKLVDNFLRFYFQTVKQVSAIGTNAFRQHKGLVTNSSGEYLILDVSGFIRGFRRKAVLSTAGMLVLLPERQDDLTITYLPVDIAIRYYKGGNSGDKQWSITNL